jgi:hypothetical protein
MNQCHKTGKVATLQENSINLINQNSRGMEFKEQITLKIFTCLKERK